MELVKNKVSRKYFVVLDDTRVAEFLLITPEGKVKNLERRLFEPQIAVHPNDLKWGRYLTKKQKDTYRDYSDEEQLYNCVPEQCFF